MLSTRGKTWSKNIWFAHGAQKPYHPETNPDAVVNFSFAENWLMHDDLIQFINTHSQFDNKLCAYGEGYTGTVRLRTAMAKHLNTHFNPFHEIDPEQITFAAGVTALNEACTLVTCNPDNQEAILIGNPVYGVFARDLAARTGAVLAHANFGDADQFSPDCVAAYEAAFEEAKANGVTVRALVICNPHNPLGQCYPRETLVGLMRLCASKGIHLISDEIYALSVYNRDDRPVEKFTSVLSIDTTDIIDPKQVHALYGMSKDFGAAGMRLGCLVTRSNEFTQAVRSVCCFSSPSQFSMDLAAKLLEDQAYLAKFLEKSRATLQRGRLLAEELLAQVGISYHDKGNAGLFMWLDLAPFLPLDETNGDGWAAERLLSKRLEQAGVVMSTGEQYRASTPGKFRFVFCLEEDEVREGVKRISRVLKK
ncbi:hypothetical protein M426DRAFT_15136 [Hypoxylon sp. CI-4A]|nr:hypothetical protein M426DRAFT_15136 [Hypoxylon sp. CI-4A]